MDGIGSEEAPAPEAEGRTYKRREGRKAFLKRAQVVFEGTGVDCIVENMSKGGARVRFGNPIALPEVLALRFHDGASHPARRRWAHGAVAGLEFSGAGPEAEAERRDLARTVRDAMAAADPAEALRSLRYAWFFGDEELRRAANTLEMAHAKFLGALAPHMGQPRPAMVIEAASGGGGGGAEG